MSEAGCICTPIDPSLWTRYGDAVEPGSEIEPDPGCPVHFPDAVLLTPAVVKVTDSMGDHWVCDGVSVYPTRLGVFVVPVFWHPKSWHSKSSPASIFPTLDAAVDAIHTHLKGGG